MKKKLLFGITSLTLGGAERVLVDIANKLSEEYDITIFTIYAKGEFEKELKNKVKLISMCDKSYSELTNMQKHLIMPLKVLLNRKQIYNKYIKGKFDIEVSFLEGPITRIISTRARKNNVKKIAWLHNDMRLVFGKGIKSVIKKSIDKNIYGKYDKIVFVSKDNKEKFDLLYKDGIRNKELVKVKEEVVHNYVNKEKILEKALKEQDIKFDKNKINFVTVCRLVEQKALERLIEIHTKLVKNQVDYNMYVIGDGPLREELEKKIKENGIEETFKILGKRENPYPYMKNSDVFCLLSYFEGYPMVVEEAKILGKRILITNTAAREVVEEYNQAVIVENNEHAIYKAIKEEVNNIRANPQVEHTYNQYDNENIIKEVKRIIEK